MGRWEPDAYGRLAHAAMALYAERGFDRTTVAEIAHSAGLSESSFFRHFPDKREVLFAGFPPASEFLARVIAEADEATSAFDMVNTALTGGADGCNST